MFSFLSSFLSSFLLGVLFDFPLIIQDQADVMFRQLPDDPDDVRAGLAVRIGVHLA